MKAFFKYFDLNSVERRGFIVLASIIFFSILIPQLYSYFKKEEQLDYAVNYLPKSKEKAATEDDAIYSSTNYSKEIRKPDSDLSVIYFDFDPNVISRSNWKDLGFSDKQVDVIENYIGKGGRFYKAEDLKKIYSISEKKYSELLPYIKIDIDKNNFSKKETAESRDNIEKSNKSEDVRVININEADTADFKVLKGIGSVLSKRIVKYRDALGGFHAVEQVKEVYGLSEEVYEDVVKYLTINNTTVKLIQVNSVNQEQLSTHPYINWKQAKLIINYRNEHGKFENMTSLKKIKVLDQDFFRKIEPYLLF